LAAKDAEIRSQLVDAGHSKPEPDECQHRFGSDVPVYLVGGSDLIDDIQNVKAAEVFLQMSTRYIGCVRVSTDPSRNKSGLDICRWNETAWSG
jgi:hypothetical protein